MKWIDRVFDCGKESFLLPAEEYLKALVPGRPLSKSGWLGKGLKP